MLMTTKQRVATFCFGIAMGCVVATLILGRHGLPKAPERPDEGVIRREVPGAVTQWMQMGVPIEGDFILSESIGAASADGQILRWIVVPGLDPGAYIRVEEKSPSTDLRRVTGWKFMFADRVHAQLQPDADTRALSAALAAHGWHYLGGKSPGNWVTVQLDDHKADTVTAALKEFQAWPQWIAQAEPDYLPTPSPTDLKLPQ